MRSRVNSPYTGRAVTARCGPFFLHHEAVARTAGAQGSVRFFQRFGNMCTEACCGGERMPPLFLRHGNVCTPHRLQNAGRVRNVPASLHHATRSVTHGAGKTTRNALGDCGPVVSLNRRSGSQPLRYRPSRPMTVCRAKASIGLHSEFFPPHPTHLRCPRNQARAYHAVCCANTDTSCLDVVGPSVYHTDILV